MKCVTKLYGYSDLATPVRGRSQVSTFMKAYREYARGRGSGNTVRFPPP